MVIEFSFLTAFFAVGLYESLYSGLLFLVLQVEVLLKYSKNLSISFYD